MAGRALQISRTFTTNKALLDSLAEPLKATAIQEKPHQGTAKMWKKMFFFLACPAVLVAYVNVSLQEEPERPEFKRYSYLRIRNKTYPWRDGVKTLFHNPHTNALPDGYEDELHH